MADSIFPHKPSAAPPVADSIAHGLLDAIDRECARRAGEHVDGWRAFWQSNEASPQEIADAMGPSAALFFGLAAANITHIATVAEIVQKSPVDFMPVECLSTPVVVKLNPDGTVTIG